MGHRMKNATDVFEGKRWRQGLNNSQSAAESATSWQAAFMFRLKGRITMATMLQAEKISGKLLSLRKKFGPDRHSLRLEWYMMNILRMIITCFFSAFLFSCGGGDGTGGKKDVEITPLAVLSVSPEDQSLDIARNTTIHIDFSGNIDQSTVSADSVRLMDSDGHVFIKYNIAVEDQRVKLQLFEPLYPNTEYYISVSAAVRDIFGDSLDSEFISSFSTANSVWRGIEPIVKNAGDVYTAIDNHGNAINITWSYNYANSRYQIGMAERRNGVWGNWEVISEPLGQVYYPDHYPRVAMDNNGDAIVVWDQSDDYAVIMKEYRNGAWSDLIYVDHPDTGWIASPSVAMSDAGNALIAWSRDGNIQQLEYRNGSWGVQKKISSDNNAQGPLVQMNSLGDGIAVWKHESSTQGLDMLYSSSYTQGAWSTPTPISVNGIDPGFYRLAFNQNGEAIVVWDQNETPYMAIYKNELRDGMWTGPEKISTVNAIANEPVVDMGKPGTGMIVWREYSGGAYNIKALHLTNDTWSDPVTISSGISNKRFATVEVDIKGNAVAAWSEQNGSDWQLRLNRFLNGSWTGNQLFSTSNNSLNPVLAHIATNESGETIVVWEQSDSGIWSFYRNLYN